MAQTQEVLVMVRVEVTSKDGLSHEDLRTIKSNINATLEDAGADSLLDGSDTKAWVDNFYVGLRKTDGEKLKAPRS